ncbi:MAG: hypothetical protein KKD76_02260, partial [Verrucomicrobia bacterium]|nr:hypothetical protein [Verrucomicrobiota bacterium]
EGAGEIQYAPTVPIRVLRFPDAGDMRGAITGSKRMLWGYGLFSHYYPLGEILAKKGFEVERLDGAAGFPEELEELLAYRMVILSNLGAAHLSASSRAALSQYVRAGGALLVIGGSCALGNARTKGTDLEEMLPVKLTGPFEVLPRHGQEACLTVPLRSGMVWMTGLAWKDSPQIYWTHRVTVLPGAEVLAYAGKDPALVAWQYGRGKVIVYVGTVEGEPAPGDLPAWEWRGWTPLWDKVLDLLLAPVNK